MKLIFHAQCFVNVAFVPVYIVVVAVVMRLPDMPIEVTKETAQLLEFLVVIIIRTYRETIPLCLLEEQAQERVPVSLQRLFQTRLAFGGVSPVSVQPRTEVTPLLLEAGYVVLIAAPTPRPLT